MNILLKEINKFEVPKDELEKERQKWEIRVCELETQIEKLRNDLANSEMEKKPLVIEFCFI